MEQLSHKIRVHELAKKYNMNNKDFLDFIKDKLLVDASSHLSGLSDEDTAKIEKHFDEKNKKAAVPAAEAVKPQIQVPVKKAEEAKPAARPAAKPTAKPVVKPTAKHISKPAVKPAVKPVEEPVTVLEPTVPSVAAPFEDTVIPTFIKFKDNKGTTSRGHFKKETEAPKNEKTMQEKMDEVKVIKVPDEIPIKELAEKLKMTVSEVIKKLFLKGHMVTLNSIVPFELAEEVALDYDILVEKEIIQEEDILERFNLDIEDKPEELKDRPPVITVMGHVDHGKTSLLDAIRSTTVASGEHGGITQKIGAYQVEKNGKKITFIDTPGHEAFTEMRARGTKVTDIAVLVVAADDGVMPQTIEAISHAKAANVPIIVAVNKIDKPDANPATIRTQLTEYELVDVAWGGSTEYVEVSAKKKINLEALLETILITAELLELKANFKKRAKGVILESKLDPKLGAVADILIQEGTLEVGDIFISGATYGKVRSMINDKGKRVQSAAVSTPIEITGFSAVPEAGDVFYVVDNEKIAKKIVDEVVNSVKRKEEKRKHLTLDELHLKLENDKLKEIKLIIKADSKGAVEALKESVCKLSNEEVKVNVIHSSSGAVTEGDVKLAEASDAIIIGFNVRPTTKAIIEAEKEQVEIRTYNVIYHVTEELEKAIKGMLTPQFKEVYLGRAEIKQVFRITKVGTIAGCIVEDGKIKRDSNVRILRNGIIIHDGKLSSLKRFANDASEVAGGQECGMGIEGYNDIKEGDTIEAYMFEEIKR